MDDLKERDTLPGGAYFEIRSVKSDCSTSIFNVICSSPDIKGFIITDN